MSGLRKQKKYDWKDSNMALFGSDTDKKVKKDSAQTEPAWQGSGQKTGLQIWRIVKFKVTDWAKDSYGEFYDGDSYILLNTYKEGDSDELLYDVHFWIGKYSTQDEYGTAAYKTVELDTLLDDKPVQHREVQGHESKLFKSYFKSMTILKGGADTGFRRVMPEEYRTRLLKFCGLKKQIEVKEVQAHKSKLNSEDVFIIDMGLQIYQFNGKTANKDEKFKAIQYVQQLKSDRGGKVKCEVLDERDCSLDDREFDCLTDGEEDDDDDADDSGPVKMLRLSDASGHIEFTEVAEGADISKDRLDSNDVFIVDGVTHLFVWTGNKASIDERRNAMSYAHRYLMKSTHPTIPVTCVKEGGKQNSEFNEVFQ